MSANMPDILKAIVTLRATFDKYAGQDGDCKTLTKKELGDLLHNELPVIGQDSQQKGEAEKIFTALDQDADGVVDFAEYTSFVAALATLLTM